MSEPYVIEGYRINLPEDSDREETAKALNEIYQAGIAKGKAEQRKEFQHMMRE